MVTCCDTTQAEREQKYIRELKTEKRSFEKSEKIKCKPIRYFIIVNRFREKYSSILKIR